MNQKRTFTAIILTLCLGLTSCGQPAQTTQSQVPASTATPAPASPSATRAPAEPTQDPRTWILLICTSMTALIRQKEIPLQEMIF
ncbi:MAG: hypothetical protein V8R67_03600 [Eubacterium sp.]